MSRNNKGPRLELNNGTGFWEIRWTDNRRSKRLSTKTSDRQEATRCLALFLLEGEKAQQEELKAKAGGLTVGEVLDFYIDRHVQKKVVDKRREIHGANECLRPYFGHLRLNEVTDELVEGYSKARALSKAGGGVGPGKGKSAGTIRRELTTLVSALNFAVFKKLITADDAPSIEMPAKPAARDFWLREDESVTFMAAARAWGNERGRLFVALALYTASRRRAIETLDWSQIDLDHGMVHYNPPGRTQTKKRRVSVPICPELRAELEQVAPDLRTGFVLGHSGEITSIFESIRRFAAQRTKNKRFLRVSPHTLRHTWATQAARAGISLYKIAGVLGDSMATVEQNYLKWCPENLRDAVDFRSVRATQPGGPGQVIPFRKRQADAA